MLELQDVSVSYGRVEAVRRVSLTIPRGGIVTTHQHIAIDSVVFILQVHGGDVLKRGDHFYGFTQRALQRHHGRLAVGQLHPIDLWRHQGHGDIHEDFARERITYIKRRGLLRRIGHREDDDVRVRRGVPIGCALHGGFAIEQGVEFPRTRQGLDCIPRAQHHRVALQCPAKREATAFFAGAA